MKYQVVSYNHHCQRYYWNKEAYSFSPHVEHATIFDSFDEASEEKAVANFCSFNTAEVHFVDE